MASDMAAVITYRIDAALVHERELCEFCCGKFVYGDEVVFVHTGYIDPAYRRLLYLHAECTPAWEAVRRIGDGYGLRFA